MAQLSRRFPRAHLEILGRLDVGRGEMLTDLRIASPEPELWAEEIAHLPTVRRAELLSESPDATLVRVTHSDRGFLPVLARVQVLRQFPFPVENGVARWTIISQESRLRRLLDELKRASPGVQVEAVHSRIGTGVIDTLTARQKEIFERAMALGYFEVPRGVSLTELAERLGISKSTLSEALAIIERKMLSERVPPAASHGLP